MPKRQFHYYIQAHPLSDDHGVCKFNNLSAGFGEPANFMQQSQDPMVSQVQEENANAHVITNMKPSEINASL
jgi:hypothetical protein